MCNLRGVAGRSRMTSLHTTIRMELYRCVPLVGFHKAKKKKPDACHAYPAPFLPPGSGLARPPPKVAFIRQAVVAEAQPCPPEAKKPKCFAEPALPVETKTRLSKWEREREEV